MLRQAHDHAGAQAARLFGLTASAVGLVEIADGCATLTLGGGPLSAARASELGRALEALLEDRSIRVVTVASADSDFCAGAGPDLDMLAIVENPAALLARMPVPVVAVLRGAVASVGLELALAADFRIASEDASFWMPELEQGLVPCWGGTQRLSRIAGPAIASQMILLGRRLGAQEARECGLVSELASDPEARAAEVVAQLRDLAPLALSYAKEAILGGVELPMRDGMRLEADLNALLSQSHDRAEGLAAFKEKRGPRFEGR